MTYKELIDGAAKAIGEEIHWEGSCPWLGDSYHSVQNTHPWKPVDDNNEAVMIACVLSMGIQINQITIVASLGDVQHRQEFSAPEDKQKALRLAIVTCAAKSAT